MTGQHPSEIIAQLLETIDFFESFAKQERDAVAGISEIVTESAGTQIVGPYDSAQYWFFVIEGILEQVSANEKTITLSSNSHIGFENLVRSVF